MKGLTRKRPAPSNETAAAIEINAALKIMMTGYAVWYALYFALGIATIVLPGLAAMGIGSDVTRQILSGSGAIAAGVFAFLRPHDIASGYDAALQKVWQIEVAYNLGLLSAEEVSDGLVAAIDSSTFQYSAPAGASATPPNSSPPSLPRDHPQTPKRP